MEYKTNVLDDTCSARAVLNLIADKWTVLIVYALGHQTRRYGELKAMIGGVTHKMLTQTLRRLEVDGLVCRTVYPEVPPRVEYALTPLGKSLLSVVAVLCQWAHDHLGEVAAARERATINLEIEEAKI